MRFGPCVGVVVRFTRAFMKPFRSFLAIALNPLITCRTADLVELTQQTLCVLPTQPIAHKSNLVVPRFSDVNQVRGLICKGCYRSIPTSVLSLKGEQDDGSRLNVYGLTLASFFDSSPGLHHPTPGRGGSTIACSQSEGKLPTWLGLSQPPCQSQSTGGQ